MILAIAGALSCSGGERRLER